MVDSQWTMISEKMYPSNLNLMSRLQHVSSYCDVDEPFQDVGSGDSKPGGRLRDTEMEADRAECQD